LIELATVLTSLNVEQLSTGGTAKAIRDADFKVTNVSIVGRDVYSLRSPSVKIHFLKDIYDNISVLS
jgi:AICAR transformylase/IMP cyclohydrolase PurH